MRHLIIGTIAALGAAGFAGGCGTTGGTTVAKYTRNSQPLPTTEAPADGQYGLYYSSDVTPQVKYTLKKGDRLGFIEKETKIYAVAGDREVPIDTTAVVRTAYWKQSKE